jgi:hypothetical protein
LVGVDGQGQETLEALAAQVFLRDALLSWFGQYGKPACLCFVHVGPVSPRTGDDSLCSMVEQIDFFLHECTEIPFAHLEHSPLVFKPGKQVHLSESSFFKLM